ncbi:MAG: chorismate-binding protein [Tannerellaceae bacterium]|jgi:isochorismate synthase|nr:chorismate-binding protein [Tannerellaceae bacterium]
MSLGVSQRLNMLWADERDFVAYRMPHDKQIIILWNDRADSLSLYNLEELNGQNGYVFAPFAISDKCPCVLLRNLHEETYPCPCSESIPAYYRIHAQEPVRSQPTEDYRHRFAVFMAALERGEFRKIVLSRKQIVENNDCPAISTFLSACRYYPGLYVYIYSSVVAGRWMGCTPELLLAGDCLSMHTIALAATRRVGDNSEWSEKEMMEQSLVVEHIKAQLDSLRLDYIMQGPYPLDAGHLTHLRTDFRFKLSDNDHLGNILQALHPTPAVSGSPQKTAVPFILSNEGYERRYYSGFIGRLEPAGRSDVFVNLRCINIEQENISLYAGGGILPTSVLEAEWQETEEKIRTITSIPNIHVFQQ